MYQVNDYVVYGKKGVCRVSHVGEPPFFGSTGGRLYYTLNPVDTSETIYVPVDTDLFMRAPMTREDALALMDRIPYLEDCLEEISAINSKELPRYYGGLLKTHDCEDVIRLMLTIHLRARRALAERRKICQTDHDFQRDAEDILYGELALVLGMERARVAELVMERIRRRAETGCQTGSVR